MRYLTLSVTSAALIWAAFASSPLGSPVAGTSSAQEKVAQPAALPSANLERAYPNLRFERPVYLTGCGDDTGRLFVVEQDGVIRVTGKDEEAKHADVFLDLRDLVSRRGNEEGLLGLAFHPDFESNGRFYVHFSSTRDADDKGVARNAISCFRVSAEDPNRADPASEEVLLLQRQPYRNHNGGAIEFGPDGYLYASFGDGGAANDPEGNGQKLSSILGSIIRIDVDSRSEGLAYGIPDDNPFVEVEGARPELWAIGLRNVWRFSFDAEDGTLYAGEVGQNKIEEVDVIVPGGNYGWNRFEADEVFRKGTELVLGEHIAPIASYPHSDGLSITGGYVYRGSREPELQGLYFFGDYVSGNLWASRPKGDGTFHTEIVRRTGRSIASFGEDDEGELFLASFDGGLYRVVASDEPEATLEGWPERLSDAGLYGSIGDQELRADLVHYEVNAPFWSDDALKERYLELPEGTALGYAPSGAFELPVGARLIKTFASKPSGRRKEPRPVETRIIERTEDGWDAATYVWNRRGTDAVLTPQGKQFEQYGQRGVTTWHAPSSSECSSCHQASEGYALSLNAAQLNLEVDGVSQLASMIEAGVLTAPEDLDPGSIASFLDPHGSEGSLEERARVYLDVNCAMCHRPEGPGNASIDLRHETPLASTGLVGMAPDQGDLGIKEALLLAPGDPERSLLLHRVSTLGSGRMPNIGSHVADEQGVALLTRWIESME